MPQVEIKYSGDLEINIEKLFLNIEKVVNEVDPTAGGCKSRAYQASHFLHSHVLLQIGVLRKPHRDSVFMQELLDRIEHLVSVVVPIDCYYSVELNFLGEYYVTSKR